MKMLRFIGPLALGLIISGILIPRSFAQSDASAKSPAGQITIITNVAQLSRTLEQAGRISCGVRLEGVVCASSLPEAGVLVLQDETGAELLEMGSSIEKIAPGERVRIEGSRLLLRQCGFGVRISSLPVVDDDGLHPATIRTGTVELKAGLVPLEADWFNREGEFQLTVGVAQSDGREKAIAESSLFHFAPREAGHDGTRLLPGLLAEAYEGYWEKIPDFDLLRPVKTGVATIIDPSFRTRDNLVALRFTGFFDAPTNGTYSFSFNSDDGSMLFIGSPHVAIQRLGTAAVPSPAYGWIGQPMDHLGERRWLSVQGRVSQVSKRGEGLELELRSGPDSLSVGVADTEGLDAAALLDSYVCATGIGRAALSTSERIILGRLCVVDGGDLRSVGPAPGAANALPLASIRFVQHIPVKEATRELPVRVRGVITSVSWLERWTSLQDDTRGIFVDFNSVSNRFPLAGESWEVIGHTAPGNFAPMIVATEMKRLGQGNLPEPVRPNWNDLANGSMDGQWVEFRGVVSGIHSNRVSFLMPQGSLDVQMEHYIEADLKQYLHAVVWVRGALFAIWKADTREVRFGSVLVRNATMGVEIPAPIDPFEAPVRRARDLLRFEVQAGTLSRVKVRAQALCSAGGTLFSMDEGAGLRVDAIDPTNLQPGDWFEAVGYPEISGPSPLLRQAVLRKTAPAARPAPVVVGESDLGRKGLDSTLVTVEGNLTGAHSEQGAPVLEMQSNKRLFVARVQSDAAGLMPLRPGSRLRLTGVYAETGAYQRPRNAGESFELLLSSAADIRVLSQPSWWTLERLGLVVGLLLLVLLLAAIWITLLRRKVEQRTEQLRVEIRERERAERQRAVEAERSRIAQDLHDDLGSGLSEINLLVAARQQRSTEGGQDSPWLRTIASKTRRLVTALDGIVWAVDPGDNSLQSLADYLTSFAGDFLAHSGIVCRFKVPILFPDLTLEGRVRHSVLMVVKESLNNIVRHAGATEVEFHLAIENNTLAIVISDNGKGFDAAAPQDGHGLKNLAGRLEQLGGKCQVDSAPGRGTTVSVQLPLDALVVANSGPAES